MLEFLVKIVQEIAAENRRRAEEQQRAWMGAQQAAAAPEQKTNKRRHQEDAGPVAEPAREEPVRPAVAEPAPPPEAVRPDLRRMMVLSEVLGPPLALRED
jgi:hypothetical protein